MRKPSDLALAFAWHAQACAGRAWHVQIHEDEPLCGFFKARLARKAPFVPARIWLRQEVDDAGELTSPEVLLCEIDGVPKDPVAEWTRLCQYPITQTEFEYMTRLRAWQRANAPEEYQAAWRPVDHLKTPILEE